MLTTDGPMTYSKAPFYATLSFTVLAVMIILLIIIISLIGWIIKMVLNWFRKGKYKRLGLDAIASGVGIGTSIAILILFASLFSSGIDPVYQLPQEAYMPTAGSALPVFMPILMWICSCLLLTITLFAWLKGLWTRMARVHYSLFTLAVMGLMWMFDYWNIFVK